MQLCDHAFRQLLDLGARSDLGAAQQFLGARARKIGMHGLDIVEQLGHLDPPRQHSHVSNEANLLHQLLALPERVQTQHRQVSIAIGETEYSLEQRRFAGTIRANQAEDPAFLDVEADIVDGADIAKMLRHVSRGDQASHSLLPLACCLFPVAAPPHRARVARSLPEPVAILSPGIAGVRP